MLIDDAFAEEARCATRDFLDSQPGEWEIVFDQPVVAKAHPTWWGGSLLLRRM